jgi:hypothetical protein
LYDARSTLVSSPLDSLIVIAMFKYGDGGVAQPFINTAIAVDDLASRNGAAGFLLDTNLDCQTIYVDSRLSLHPILERVLDLDTKAC